jgi:uncharacterized membrane protein
MTTNKPALLALLLALSLSLAPALAQNPNAPSPIPVVVERATIPDTPAPAQTTGQKIADALRARGLSENATITLISLLPIVELRGAIPVGHVLIPSPTPERPFTRANLLRSARIYCWAVLGNMIPVPFILLLLGPISRFCMRVPVGKRFFDWLFARTRRKTAGLEKYKFFALTVFVAIPLPVTGAWTGAMAGWLIGMPFLSALFSTFLGVLIAGVVMTALSLMGWWGAAIALIALLALLASSLAKR